MLAHGVADHRILMSWKVATDRTHLTGFEKRDRLDSVVDAPTARRSEARARKSALSSMRGRTTSVRLPPLHIPLGRPPQAHDGQVLSPFEVADREFEANTGMAPNACVRRSAELCVRASRHFRDEYSPPGAGSWPRPSAIGTRRSLAGVDHDVRSRDGILPFVSAMAISGRSRG